MERHDESDRKVSRKKGLSTTSDLVKGKTGYSNHTGKNYEIQFNTSPTCKVNVMDKTAGRKGLAVIRLDKAHGGPYNYNHININPAISGRPDPHLRLPKGGLTAGTGVAKFCKYANKVDKVVVPVAIAIDAAEIYMSVCDDIQNETTRNTVESVASVAGGWGGGFGGAAGGAAIGTGFCPGVGTIAGGIIGGIGGAIGGSYGASALTDFIGDAVDYDVEERVCDKCGRKFKVRKYKGERSRLCPKCSKKYLC